MEPVTTFHVVRERRGRQPVVMIRMVTDRLRLRRVEGLEFAKVLGTGRGGDTGPSADLRRQAYVLVWRDADAVRRFLASHLIARRWRRLTVEHDLALRLVSGHGRWSGQEVLDRLPAAPAEGEVVVVTRARIRVTRWSAFRRASVGTAEAMAGAPGLRWALGIGELPVGLLGTVSCWASAEALDAFLASEGTHASVVPHAADWFAESLFARFAPVDPGLFAGSPPPTTSE